MRARVLVILILLELAAATAACWFLLPNLYHAALYRVDPAQRPPLVNFVPFAVLVLALTPSLFCLVRVSPRPTLLSAVARAWSPLLASLALVLRAVLGLKPFFLEPLLLALSVAAAVLLSFASGQRPARENGLEPAPSKLPILVTLAAFLLLVVWFYRVESQALSKLALGYVDGGIYYLRVKNTALGRGLLQETLARPPFYDHFDPGLILLVPVYWIIPSFTMIMWVQGFFLAAVGPAVYVYARGRGVGAWVSLVLAFAALLHPSVSQMNYAFSYGFHPVSLSIPAVILSIRFWEKRRWIWFAVAAAFAASMEETVLPLYFGMGLAELAFSKGFRRPAAILAAASVAFFFVVTRIVMPEFAGSDEYFQMAKFAHLGSSLREILLSPLTKPVAFWGLIFSRQSIVFVLLLLGSTAFFPLLAPRRLLYPAIVLVFVLLLSNPDVKSISFQYQAMIVAAWFPAAVAGARKLSSLVSKGQGPSPRCMAAVAVALFAAALMMSHFYAMLPWSRATVPFQVKRNDAFMREAAEITAFARSVPKDAAVLATMRVATLFVDAGSLTPLQQWQGSTDYDLVVLQADDQWGQSPLKIKSAYETFVATGRYSVVTIGRFIIMSKL